MIGHEEIETHRSLVRGKYLCNRCLHQAEEPVINDQIARDMEREWRNKVRSGEDEDDQG